MAADGRRRFKCHDPIKSLMTDRRGIVYGGETADGLVSVRFVSKKTGAFYNNVEIVPAMSLAHDDDPLTEFIEEVERPDEGSKRRPHTRRKKGR